MALVLHNPVPHALFALPVGVWLLVDKSRRRQLLPLGLGYLPLTALLLFGWLVLTDAMGLRPIAHAPTNTYTGSRKYLTYSINKNGVFTHFWIK